MNPDRWSSVAPIAWALFAAHALHGYLSWRYFFAGPGVFSTVISALLGIGVQKARDARAPRPRRPTCAQT